MVTRWNSKDGIKKNWKNNHLAFYISTRHRRDLLNHLLILAYIGLINHRRFEQHDSYFSANHPTLRAGRETAGSAASGGSSLRRLFQRVSLVADVFHAAPMERRRRQLRGGGRRSRRHLAANSPIVARRTRTDGLDQSRTRTQHEVRIMGQSVSIKRNKSNRTTMRPLCILSHWNIYILSVLVGLYWYMIHILIVSDDCGDFS